MKTGVAAVFLSLSMMVSLCSADVIYVDTDATGLTNGSSWSDAYTNLQNALSAAVSNDEIWVAAGTYIPGTNRTATFQLEEWVYLYGGFDGTETNRDERNRQANATVLTGDVNGDDAGFINNSENVYHVVSGADNAIIDGFVITGGNADGTNPDNSGGGMRNNNASPLVANCTFRENEAVYNGGGMANYNSSSPTVRNCEFSGNRAGYGGGMENTSCVGLSITNCRFFGNRATGGATPCGGAIESWQCSVVTVQNCIFAGNEAEVTGGAMESITCGDVTVANCMFIGNWADDSGGGMENYQCSEGVTLQNCTFSGNQAGSEGGGMRNEDALLTLVNCILWTNSVGSGGNEIHNYNNSTCTVSFCDIAGGIGGIVNEGGSAVIDEGTNLAVNPLFMGGPGGSWTGDAVYDPDRFESTLTNSEASWTPGELAEKFINPDTSQVLQYVIVSNDVTTLTVRCDVSGITQSGDSYQIYDYHLQGGSPCIDAGKNAVGVLIDLDGVPRPLDGDANDIAVCDMGVYEFVHATADTDGDELSDTNEIYVYETDPRLWDSDSDQMPDGWEVAYLLNPVQNDAAGDADSDNLSNLGEYIAGTVPTNAASVLAFTGAAVIGGDPVIYWSSVSNRLYDIEATTNLLGGWSSVVSNVVSMPPTNTYEDTNAPVSGSYYYRIATTNDTTNQVLTVNTAAFHWLDIMCGTNGSVDVGDGWYTNGAGLTITAMPSNGYHFVGWTGDIETNANPLTLTMDHPYSVTVNFELNADLSVTKTVNDFTPNPGDTITYTVVVTNHGPDNATGVEVTDAPPSGITYVSDSGGGSYNSGSGLWSVGSLSSGSSTTLTITATVDSGTAGQSITNTASITALDQWDGDAGNDSDVAVTTINHEPVANADSASTDEDTPVVINVLTNDVDADMYDVLTITNVTQGSHGSVAIGVGNTNVIYTPNTNYNGADSFTYVVSDGNGGSDTGTISVTVSAVNDSPVAANDVAETDEDTGVTVDVLANDSDVDAGDTLTVTNVTQGSHGSVAIGVGNTNVIYTPNTNYNGADSFTYVVSDGNGGSDTATVSVTVTAVNDAPVIAAQARTLVTENQMLEITFNDVIVSDPDNTYPDDFTLTVYDGVNYTRVNNTISHLPGFNGLLTVPVTVNDGQADSDQFNLEVIATIWLGVTSGANGTVDDVNGWYQYGTGVVISATGDVGHCFAEWTGDIPSTEVRYNPVTVIMNQTRNITATFTNDVDGDTLPDWWETNYFGGLGELPGDNTDGDAYTQKEEYQMGLNPTKLDVGLPLLAIEIGWESEAGTNYQLQWNPDLLSTQWFNVSTSVVGTGTNNVAFDSIATKDCAFYRVVGGPVTLQPWLADEIRWQSLAGTNYQIQLSPTGLLGSWTNTGSPVTGTGGTNAAFISNSNRERRYYRLDW